MVAAIVVDASVVAGWLLEDEANAYTEHVARQVESGAKLIAPNLLLWEVSNLLLMAEKRGRLEGDRAGPLMAKLAALPWEWDKPAHFSVMNETMELGRSRGLTAYDAAYLRLAQERDLPLATQDKALRIAARAAGVALIENW